MQEINELIKQNPLLPAEDFNAMRIQGFQSIEKLGHKVWTEYNNSDPGITILDAVIYAITDLSYRTGFEVKDLIAPEKPDEDTWRQVFYTARQILHNSPLTLTDYRKLIIDVPGVRNAWIEPSKEYEVPLWIDYNYFEKRKDENCGCADQEQITCFGKLQLDAATEDDAIKFREEKKTAIQEEIKKLETRTSELEKNKKEIADRLEKEQDLDPYTILQLKESLKKIVRKLRKLNNIKQSALKDLELLAQMGFIESKIIELEGLYNVLIEFEDNIQDKEQKEEVRNQVVNRLCRHRNLCEDFLSVQAADYEEFGLGASIVLEEYADPDLVSAQMFFIIYKYFTPSVPFYTIQQMQDKGYDIDEIFEGPPLKHGFIDDAILEKTDLFRDMRLSDIINEIADLPGVKAITYLHLPFTEFNKPGTNKSYFNTWIRYLQDERKIALINPEKSRWIFCKERAMTTYYTGSKTDRNPDRVKKLFSDMKTAERKYKLDGVELDLPVPKGENMQLEGYFSVADTLPMCYGVTERAGLPGNATEKRVTQAKQLNGYLLFFEQLLVNYLAQLNHIRDIFTMDESVNRTYFVKPVEEIHGVRTIKALEELLINHNDHDNFQKVLDDFIDVMENLAEPKSLFLQRRNRFLDHFLARFSEDMSEYEQINRWLLPGNTGERFISDKSRILKNGEYYKISSNRGRGYDYCNQRFWDNLNVSGLERRAGRLLGFSNPGRRSLSVSFISSEAVMEPGTNNQRRPRLNTREQPLHKIRIYDPENNERVLLTSEEVAEGCCIELLINDILYYGDNRSNYKFYDKVKEQGRKSGKGEFWFELFDGPAGSEEATLIAVSPHFDRRDTRDKTFRDLQSAIDLINDNEGMHLVEHILLRPKFDEVTDDSYNPIPVSTLKICVDECGLGIGLGEGTQTPKYRKKITRIPAEKCYDNLPWILQYFRTNPVNGKQESILFEKVSPDNSEMVLMKFSRYESMVDRIRALEQYGSDRNNYTIEPNDETGSKLKYCFYINGKGGKPVAQSPYMFSWAKDGKNPAADDIEKEIQRLIEWFGYEMDWYCEANPCDSDEDPYSFRATVLLPCWPRRMRDATFRNFVEKTIITQAPAHVDVRIVWLGIPEMNRFEKVYYAWLEEMSQTKMPSYNIVNPLIDVLNSLKPCGVCEDECKDRTKEPRNPNKENDTHDQ